MLLLQGLLETPHPVDISQFFDIGDTSETLSSCFYYPVFGGARKCAEFVFNFSKFYDDRIRSIFAPASLKHISLLQTRTGISPYPEYICSGLIEANQYTVPDAAETSYPEYICSGLIEAADRAMVASPLAKYPEYICSGLIEAYAKKAWSSAPGRVSGVYLLRPH